MPLGACAALPHLGDDMLQILPRQPLLIGDHPLIDLGREVVGRERIGQRSKRQDADERDLSAEALTEVLRDGEGARREL